MTKTEKVTVLPKLCIGSLSSGEIKMDLKFFEQII